ncbi:diguanylate cyclase [Rubellimicrobium sp. CFH 75288]|uniref:diguanylate cyclase n=1 Tax=Rubellimicrobium sp. CFH 75288 TaxID=2697034 RepID=UPI00141311DC|nr:diguanylate cyclase [Rubellimicrobium sp. CFH 75288]NAZ35258.1 diguanylate cyclase [Rubellimicrobium sp. CFH 75288]
MTGRIMIVGSDAPRRLLLRAALEAAGLAAEDHAGAGPLARRAAGRGGASLALVDAGDGGEGLGALAACGRSVPALVLVPAGRTDLRIAALAGGAEDIVERDSPPRLLLARVRRILRDRARTRDLDAAGGLAEAPAAFLGPAAGRVALLPAPAGEGVGSDLAALGRGVALVVPEGDEADLYILDARGLRGDLPGGIRILDRLAELRARTEGQHAATLVLLPDTAPETAALALDLGADGVACGPAGTPEIELRVRLLLQRKARADRLRATVRAHLEAALRDPLTGLHNRRHAEPELHRLIEEARARREPLALLVLDIDHFKAVNDRWGHGAGDRVLAEVARRLRTRLGEGCLLARMGGEEFLAVLPGARAAQARAVAESLRRAVESQPFALDRAAGDGALAATGTEAAWIGPRSRTARVTLSVGVAAAGPEDLARGLDAPSLLERADAALYAAKSGGRNMVTVAVPAPAN